MRYWALMLLFLAEAREMPASERSERIRKAWAIFMTNPQGRLGILKTELQKLADHLLVIERIEDPLTRLVNFLSAVAPWHDRFGELVKLTAELSRVNWGQFTRSISLLEQLGKCFVQSGRNQLGRNRTLSGEAVSEEKVFLLKGTSGPMSIALLKSRDVPGYYRQAGRHEAAEFLEEHMPRLETLLGNFLREQNVP